MPKSREILKEIVDKFIAALQAKKRATLKIGEALFSEVVELFREAGIKAAEECLSRIKNQQHREMLETLLFSTAAFAIAGGTIGGAIAGPHGAIIGATAGACIGWLSAFIVITIRWDSDSGKYIFST